MKLESRESSERMPLSSEIKENIRKNKESIKTNLSQISDTVFKNENKNELDNLNKLLTKCGFPSNLNTRYSNLKSSVKALQEALGGLATDGDFGILTKNKLKEHVDSYSKIETGTARRLYNLREEMTKPETNPHVRSIVNSTMLGKVDIRGDEIKIKRNIGKSTIADIITDRSITGVKVITKRRGMHTLTRRGNTFVDSRGRHFKIYGGERIIPHFNAGGRMEAGERAEKVARDTKIPKPQTGHQTVIRRPSQEHEARRMGGVVDTAIREVETGADAVQERIAMQKTHRAITNWLDGRTLDGKVSTIYGIYGLFKGQDKLKYYQESNGEIIEKKLTPKQEKMIAKAYGTLSQQSDLEKSVGSTARNLTEILITSLIATIINGGVPTLAGLLNIVSVDLGLKKGRARTTRLGSFQRTYDKLTGKYNENNDRRGYYGDEKVHERYQRKVSGLARSRQRFDAARQEMRVNPRAKLSATQKEKMGKIKKRLGGLVKEIDSSITANIGDLNDMMGFFTKLKHELDEKTLSGKITDRERKARLEKIENVAKMLCENEMEEIFEWLDDWKLDEDEATTVMQAMGFKDFERSPRSFLGINYDTDIKSNIKYTSADFDRFQNNPDVNHKKLAEVYNKYVKYFDKLSTQIYVRESKDGTMYKDDVYNINLKKKAKTIIDSEKSLAEKTRELAMLKHPRIRENLENFRGILLIADTIHNASKIKAETRRTRESVQATSNLDDAKERREDLTTLKNYQTAHDRVSKQIQNAKRKYPQDSYLQYIETNLKKGQRIVSGFELSVKNEKMLSNAEKSRLKRFTKVINGIYREILKKYRVDEYYHRETVVEHSGQIAIRDREMQMQKTKLGNLRNEIQRYKYHSPRQFIQDSMSTGINIDGINIRLSRNFIERNKTYENSQMMGVVGAIYPSDIIGSFTSTQRQDYARKLNVIMMDLKPPTREDFAYFHPGKNPKMEIISKRKNVIQTWMKRLNELTAGSGINFTEDDVKRAMLTSEFGNFSGETIYNMGSSTADLRRRDSSEIKESYKMTVRKEIKINGRNYLFIMPMFARGICFNENFTTSATLQTTGDRNISTEYRYLTGRDYTVGERIDLRYTAGITSVLPGLTNIRIPIYLKSGGSGGGGGGGGEYSGEAVGGETSRSGNGASGEAVGGGTGSSGAIDDIFN